MIPKKGRLGKIASIIKEEYDEQILNVFYEGYSDSLSGKALAQWLIQMMQRMENEIGKEATTRVFETYGRQTCGKGFKNTVSKIKAKSETLQNFVDNLQYHYKKSSFFEMSHKNTIISGHYKCYFPIKHAQKPISNSYFCHVCLGHGLEFYETAFNNPVTGRILETIMTGGRSCKFQFDI